MITALDLESRRPRIAAEGLLQFRAVELLRLTLLLLLVANLGRIPVMSSGAKDAPILFNDLFVLSTLLVSGLVALRQRRLAYDLPAVVALLFAAVGAFSALMAIPRFGLSLFEVAFSLAYLVRWLVYFSLYLVVINLATRRDVGPLWSALEKMVLAFAAFGIVQSIFLPDFAQMVYPDSVAYVDWDIQGHRLVSTFLDPNLAGGLIVIGLLVHLAQVSTGASTSGWKSLLLIVALGLTVSRSSILAFLVGTVVIFAVRGFSKRLLKVGAALAVLLLPLLPALVQFAAEFNKFSVDASALARVVMWLRAFEILADNPIMGIGFNTYGFVQEAYGYRSGGNASFSLDGGLLFIAVMTGAIGVALYCLMLFLIIRRCRRIWLNSAASAQERGIGIGVAAATVAMLVHSVFLNSLLFPFIMEFLWVLWGMTFLIRTPERNESLPVGPCSAHSRQVLAEVL